MKFAFTSLVLSSVLVTTVANAVNVELCLHENYNDCTTITAEPDHCIPLTDGIKGQSILSAVLPTGYDYTFFTALDCIAPKDEDIAIVSAGDYPLLDLSLKPSALAALPSPQ